MLATEMLATAGDPKAVMEQGGWDDIRSVMGYAHDIPEHRRNVVNRRAFDVDQEPTTRKGTGGI
jgi:hypothetical protein